MYVCPVCGFDRLEIQPYEIWPPPEGLEISPPYEDFLGSPSYDVCPRCAFEFGNDDNPGTRPPSSFDEYREQWIADGRPWFDASYQDASGSSG